MIKMGAVYTVYKNDEEIGTTPNLLTNGFFSRVFGDGTHVVYDLEVGTDICIFVGTGTTEPARTDTGMEANVAKSPVISQNGGTDQSYTTLVTYDGRYYQGSNWSHTFGPGTFSGQAITELGARFSNSTGSVYSKNSPTIIDSHALIRDGLGNVIPVTLGTGDSLTIRVEFFEQMQDMRFDPSRVVIQGVATDITFGWVNYADSVAKRAQVMLNSMYDSGIGGNNNYMGATTRYSYPYNYIGVVAQAGAATKQPPTATDSTILPTITRLSTSDSANKATQVSWSAVNRTATWQYDMKVTQADINTGLAQVYMSGRNDNATLAWMWAGFDFDPPLTGITAASGISIPVTLKWGELDRFGWEDVVRVEPTRTAFTEVGTNGAYTTLNKAEVRAFGGKYPYTYAWTYVSGGSALLAADTSTLKSTSFTGTGTTQTSNEIWRCTVTDADANTATVDVTVNMSWA